jgi:hypothetical protein
VGAVKVQENLRGQYIVPEAEKHGILTAFAKTALVHAHGLISSGAVAAIARVRSSYYFSAIMTIP